jgi:hypothetical protein
MAKTVIGLFENRIAARKAVSELEESGLPPGEIRILGEPLGLGNPGVLSTAHVEFEVELARELERIGATKSEIEAYLKGLRAGGVLVFATTFDENPDAPGRILNRGGTIDVAELGGGEPHLPSLVRQNMTPLHDGSDLSLSLPGRAHYSGNGARVFVW